MTFGLEVNVWIGNHLPAPAFRFAEKRGMARLDIALSKKVFCFVGETWLMVLKARPRRPSELPSRVKDEDTCVATSTAWFSTETPPTVTVSVYTMPDEPLPSPYRMLHLAPSISFAVELDSMLYTVWFVTAVLGVWLLKTQRSEEPVSKLRFSVWGGVPIWTGARYSVSKICGTA